MIADTGSIMRISLQLSAPCVALQTINRHNLAVRITRDYLDVHTRGLNHYIRDLPHITQFSRAMALTKLEDKN